jgi:hypothetical protein
MKSLYLSVALSQMYGPVRENSYGTTTFPGIQTALAQAQTFSKTAVVFTPCNAQGGRLDGNEAHAWLHFMEPLFP